MGVLTPTATKPKSLDAGAYSRIKEKHTARRRLLLLNTQSDSSETQSLEQERQQAETMRNVCRLREERPHTLSAMVKNSLYDVMNSEDVKLHTMLQTPPNTKASFSKKILTPFKKKKTKVHNALTLDTVEQLRKLITFLQRDDIMFIEGLFRKTGSVTRQRLLRQHILEGLDINSVLDQGDFSAHDCATVLKNFLSDLSEPLLTDRLSKCFCYIAGVGADNQTDKHTPVSGDKQMKVLQLMVLLLPRENQTLLRHLLPLLQKVSTVPENKMSASSLGVVFAPSLLSSRSLSPEEMHHQAAPMKMTAAILINQASDLFTVPQELALEMNEFWWGMDRAACNKDSSSSLSEEIPVRELKSHTLLGTTRKLFNILRNANGVGSTVKKTNLFGDSVAKSLTKHMSFLHKKNKIASGVAGCAKRLDWDSNLATIKSEKCFYSMMDIASSSKSNRKYGKSIDRSPAAYVVDMKLSQK